MHQLQFLRYIKDERWADEDSCREAKKMMTIMIHLHYLAKQGLPIRGQQDNPTASADNNKGNLILLLEHQAKVSNDTLMLKHISRCWKNARYTSKMVFILISIPYLQREYTLGFKV